mmetsp:Transcript_26766/g.62561  ORF Transcript_26766/g.62561 Transcript_26766/m.62561 type:complete len:464 (+) Transcript_26766:178-1569(+)
MKRERESESSSSSKGVTADRSQTDNDCYDEIAHRHDGDSIRHSWMTNRSFIYGNSKGDNNMISLSEGCGKSDEIMSLNQQLIQVKRKLWPAAEKCAEAWNSTASEEFWSARSFANPMEALGECRNGGLNQMFINRSAIKLANIDAIMEYGLTTKVRGVTNGSGGGEIFLFADLCGAPGGFSEYIMKRIRAKGTGCHCRGYGMSLVGENEHGRGATWRMEDFSEVNATSTLDYKVHYGHDGTGDIYKWENVAAFQRDIGTDLEAAGITQRKMNLVVADGGFDAQRNSECQEGLSQKLVIYELAASLEMLDIGGTLVVKLFGFQTDTIRMAMRSMHHLFDSLELIKPISSRPASSERYVVFNCFKGLPHDWEGGPSWISSVLRGRCLQEDEESYYLSRVDNYIDQFDRDMMVLNLRACFSILSRLERKTTAAQQNHSTFGKSREFERGRKNINIKRYKHAWQLFI